MKQKDQDKGATRCRGGALMKLLLFLIIFAGIITAAWIFFLPSVLASTLEKRTGFRVKVTELFFNPFTAKVDLRGLVLSNPSSFPVPNFIEVRSFEANARMKTLFSDRPEFDYARVDVAYVTLVRDEQGVLNAQLFHNRLVPPPPAPPPTPEELKERERAKLPPPKVIKDGVQVPVRDVVKEHKAKEAAKQKPPPPEPAKEKPVNYLIQRLEVRLEKVVVVDYLDTPASVREFDLKMYYMYNDVTNPEQLMKPFAFKSLQPVGAAIRALIPGNIGRAVDEATKGDKNLFEPTTDKNAVDPLKAVVEKLEENQNP